MNAEEIGAKSGERAMQAALWIGGAATVAAFAYWSYLVLFDDTPLSRSDWTGIVGVLLLWRILLSLYRSRVSTEQIGTALVELLAENHKKSTESHGQDTLRFERIQESLRENTLQLERIKTEQQKLRSQQVRDAIMLEGIVANLPPAPGHETADD